MYKNSQRAAQSDLDIRSCFHSALCGFWLCPGCLELERRMCWLICCYLGCHGTVESIECGCVRAGHSGQCGHHWCQVSGARPRHCQLSVPLLSAPAADRCNNLPNHGHQHLHHHGVCSVACPQSPSCPCLLLQCAVDM